MMAFSLTSFAGPGDAHRLTRRQPAREAPRRGRAGRPWCCQRAVMADERVERKPAANSRAELAEWGLACDRPLARLGSGETAPRHLGLTASRQVRGPSPRPAYRFARTRTLSWGWLDPTVANRSSTTPANSAGRTAVPCDPALSQFSLAICVRIRLSIGRPAKLRLARYFTTARWWRRRNFSKLWITWAPPVAETGCGGVQ